MFICWFKLKLSHGKLSLQKGYLRHLRELSLTNQQLLLLDAVVNSSYEGVPKQEIEGNKWSSYQTHTLHLVEQNHIACIMLNRCKYRKYLSGQSENENEILCKCRKQLQTKRLQLHPVFVVVDVVLVCFKKSYNNDRHDVNDSQRIESFSHKVRVVQQLQQLSIRSVGVCLLL